MPLVLRLQAISVLRAARYQRRLTLEQTAVAAGISSAWLRQLEHNVRLLSPRVAARLLPVLGLRPEDVTAASTPAPEGRP